MGSVAGITPRRIGGVVVALSLAASILAGAVPVSAVAPAAAFDWSMPPRTGLDTDHDDVIDVIPDDAINPGTFRVDFDACGSTGASQYRWTIDGELAGETASCSGFSKQLPEGVYTVELETIAGDGSTGIVTKQVTVQDWLIVAVGDSFGSGEGNPDIPATYSLSGGTAPTWQSKRCHRSSISGQARAAKKLENADPHTSVTLVHLSCSGGEILMGLVDTYGGMEPNDTAHPLPPQLDEVKSLVGDREIDALVVSIGGNDAHFGDIVIGCMVSEPCHLDSAAYVGGLEVATLAAAFCPTLDAFGLGDGCIAFLQSIAWPDPNAAGLFADGLGALDSRAGALHDRVDELFPILAAHPSRVYWTEYPNATEDDDGSVCTFDLMNPLATLPGVSLDEGTWVRGWMTPRLNQEISGKAQAFDWTYVGGIFDAFHGHGYCADGHWFRRLDEAFLMEQHPNGAVHPTGDGHAVYRDAIYEALFADFYPSGDIGSPRPPLEAVPPVVTGVPDRVPDHAGWYSGSVTIDWRAIDPSPSSGQPTDPQDTIADHEGANVVYTSGESCDPAGNCATGSLTLSIDKTAPVVARDTGSDVCSLPGNDGWCRGTQTAGFTAADATSGVSSPCSATAGVSCAYTRATSTQGAAVMVPSGHACDVAGNCAPGSAGGPFKVDTTPPAVACRAPVPMFDLQAPGASVSATVADGVSGPEAVTVAGPADTSSVGAKSVSLTGRDQAGNATTISCPYFVAYVFAGFAQPVDNSGVVNVVKAGRAIPLRWRLTDASGQPVTNLATAGISVQGLSCAAGTTEDLVEETTSGGSGLQNLGDGNYQLNWKSPTSYAGSCKTLRLDLGEGIFRTALFHFKS